MMYDYNYIGKQVEEDAEQEEEIIFIETEGNAEGHNANGQNDDVIERDDSVNGEDQIDENNGEHEERDLKSDEQFSNDGPENRDDDTTSDTLSEDDDDEDDEDFGNDNVKLARAPTFAYLSE